MKRYAVVVTGDRNAKPADWAVVITKAIGGAKPLDNELVVIHGAATGIDTIASQVVRAAWPHVPVIPFPANWELYRKIGNPNLAGPERNAEMLRVLDSFRAAGYDCRVLAFHDYLDNSKGTANCIRQAHFFGFKVQTYTSRGK